MSIDFETLTLSGIIKLQDELSQVLKRRFEKVLALAFSDIVGSTSYFERFGNEAGESMRQRHNEVIRLVLAQHNGRLIDTAGDGAFTCFESVKEAVDAYASFQMQLSEGNATRGRDHQLVTRVGIHLGPVLTDGTAVSGDPVNVCARVASTAQPGEIRITRECFMQLPPLRRLQCRSTPAVQLKGISRPIEMMIMDWRDANLFPTAMLIEEINMSIPLPQQDLITVGRLKDLDGVSANDIALLLPDKTLTQQISRWHFELRRHRDGVTLRSVTDIPTEVDGVALAKGEEKPIRAGSVVKVARVVTLRFVGNAGSNMELGRTLA